MKYELVWFKRDLRIADNAAFFNAAQTKNPTILLYIIEPNLWLQPDMSKRHYDFLCESLFELEQDLKKIGQKLIIRVGEADQVFEQINQQFPLANIFSHQETWNYWTFQRDKKILAWCKEKNIAWHEFLQNGVVRRLKNRNGWARNWNKLMRQKILPVPKISGAIEIKSDSLPNFSDLGLQEDYCFLRQKGGRQNALELLDSFLHQRGENYSKEMSSPVTAFDSCSLLSPHIAFGTISLREISQAVEQRQIELQKMSKSAKGKWPMAMRSFSGRLRWHCHFIQKLEDEPRIEFTNFHRAYDNFRLETNDDFFEAWKKGKTGFPMIDASMRCLISTGWINFRMRAMLMSFASYHLWLPWQKTAIYLARLFTDYEPGIHYSQAQMQSGTTGINAIRIYNPIKQGFDHDPQGVFIRRWLPELAEVSDDYIHTPWLQLDLVKNYPLPIVDEATARKAAAQKIYALRKELNHKLEAKKIVTKHGSRKSGLKQTVKGDIPPKTSKKLPQSSSMQMDLFGKN